MIETQTLEVVGVFEVAEMLEVEAPAVTRWRKSGKLPEPWVRLKCSPIWLREDIERFRNERDGGPRGVPASPPAMSLLGTWEVADLLGVDKSQIGRWRRDPPRHPPRLPAPVAEIQAGPLWSRRDILRFARARKRAA